MKRIGLLCLAFALAAANSAQAQLTMQMSNGWTFTFAGNVNGFFTYEDVDDGGGSDGAAGIPLTPSAGEGASRIRSGFLPAFAVLDAKGKEGNTDLGVHFGFAPVINLAQGVHDRFEPQSAGSQIDMRQVYLTIGGSWGQLLVGRELGIYARQNILNDQTLFGTGGTLGIGGGSPATSFVTIGRVGRGYLYPNFDAQIAYSTPAGRPGGITIGLLEAVAIGPYTTTKLPRVEAEANYTTGKVKLWVGGLVQNIEVPGAGGSNLTSWSPHGGFRFGTSQVSLTGAGYYGKGVGSFLIGDASSVAGTGSGSNDARTSYGYYGQVLVTPAGSKVTLAGSYGSNYLTEADDEAAGFTTENSLASGGIYYQATKSLKVVGEFNYMFTNDHAPGTANNKEIVPTVGFMLFF